MDETTITLTTADGQDLKVYRWAPPGEPRAVVQVQHGLGEHAGRYRRFAEALTAAGYLVYAPDGRGSGRSAHDGYGVWGPDGWLGMVDDVARLAQLIHDDNPGLDLGLFGHSLGSFQCQHFLLDHSSLVTSLVLCGSTEVGAIADALGSPDGTDLSAFNAAFAPRTGCEWLSRDEDEVDAYVADPACGWQSQPLTGIDTLKRAADPEELSQIRPAVPVLVISGDQDPVAGPGAGGPQLVAQRYLEAGFGDVLLKLYPGARHELLNETNRDQVTADVLTFFDRTLAVAPEPAPAVDAEQPPI